MAVASLSLKISDNNTVDNGVILETGTLRYIDSIIKSFENAESLKRNEDFKEQTASLSDSELQQSKVILTYIKNNNEKILLKPIYNDESPICTRASALEEIQSETEKARKLLFSSKNQMFLSMFLSNKDLVRTTYSTIKITSKEAKKIKSSGLPVFMKDGEYRTTVKDILKYHLDNKKMGLMRLVIEDALEMWRKHMMSLAEEDLYYYSRELRVLLNEYDYKKIPRRAVYNLNLNKPKLDSLGSYKINYGSNTSTKALYKQKILEDRKSA